MKEYRDDNGLFHRENGPAIILSDGTQEWYVHGKRHREDGPAVIWSNGTHVWFFHDNLHREDGPAVIWSNGTQEWWFHGEEVDPMKHLVLVAAPSSEISDERTSTQR